MQRLAFAVERSRGLVHGSFEVILASSTTPALGRDNDLCYCQFPLLLTPWVRIWSQIRFCALGVDMAGKFVLKKGSTGKFHFNLLASNGQVIATSEAYERKQSALAGIESVKKNAPDAEIEDQTEE